jgi:hypothetical protein
VILVSVLALAFVGSIYIKSRSSNVDAANVNDDWTDYGVGPSGPAPMAGLDEVAEPIPAGPNSSLVT